MHFPSKEEGETVMNPTDEQEIYNDILESICSDVVCAKHRKVNSAAFTRTITSQERKEDYPQFNETKDDVEERQEWCATDQPVSKRFRTSFELPYKLRVDGDEASIKEITEAPANDRITRHQQNHTDIWGRIPLKEPKELAFCSICRRQVSVIRFAPHLDKCMGIGITTRIATSTISKP